MAEAGPAPPSDAASEDSAISAFDTGLQQAGRAQTVQSTQTAQREKLIKDMWYANSLTVGAMLLLYGVFITSTSAWLITKGRDSEEVLRLVAVLSAVIIAGFLLVVGYDDKQMTPVIGLLGTIVGYLLGKEQGVRVGIRKIEDEDTQKAADGQ